MVGGVIDGQDVSAAITDPAFIYKNADDVMPNKLGLARALSGSSIDDIQATGNKLYTATGASEVATGTVYGAPASTITNGDSHQTALTALANKFDPSTGHGHTGGAGDGPRVNASAIANVPLQGRFVQASDITVSGLASYDASSLMSGKTPSSSSSTAGVVVNVPYNKVVLRDATNDDNHEDAFGNAVYGRLTYAASVWTLTFYVDIGGVETPFTFGALKTARWYYQTLENPLTSTVVYNPLAFIPSENATADVLPATTTQQGKTQLATAAPGAIAATGSAGTANVTVANADHTHEGLHSVKATAQPQIKGDAEIAAGTGISLAQAGSVITISVTGGSSGGGGGGEWRYGNTDGSPVEDTEFNQKIVLFMQASAAQLLHRLIKVPAGYVAGTQITMAIDFYSPSTSNNWLFTTTAALIRRNTDAAGSTTNTHASTNTAVTNAAPANKSVQVLFDLTDGSGQINGVAVAAQDSLEVSILRSAVDTDTADVRMRPDSTDVRFT